MISTPKAIASPLRATAQRGFPLWGGHAAVIVADQTGLAGALTQVKRTVAAFDVAYSSFRDDSELTLLNASPDVPVAVSPLLLTVICESLRAARETEGRIDPTVGSALLAHGVNPRWSPVIQPQLGPAAGFAGVEVDETRCTVQIPRGACLDLGAIAKALATDMATAAAAAAAGCGIPVALCGDIATAGAPPADGWKIRVTDDHHTRGSCGQTITINDGAVATSTVTARHASNETIHHLIYPANGLPSAGPWQTVSVTAQSCVDANTASIAAILDSANAPAGLADRQLSARLVATNGTVQTVGNWPTSTCDR